MYQWIMLLHVLGAFTFVAAHGASMITAFQLRGERDRSRQAALLQASQIGILDALATSNRPWVLATAGGIGLVAIIWLMLAKPF